jgi:hypothetical protein
MKIIPAATPVTSTPKPTAPTPAITTNSAGLKSTLTKATTPEPKVVATATTNTTDKPTVVEVSADLKIDSKDAEIVGPASVVEQKIFGWLEHGKRSATNAIVLHMTGGAAKGTLTQYSKQFVVVLVGIPPKEKKFPTNGAHFLIGRDGQIYQTAKIGYRTNHVGNVRPRGYRDEGHGNKENKSLLTAKEMEILHPKTKEKMSDILEALSNEQLKKPYSSDINDNKTRYPFNGDSIGIEFESTHDEKTKPKSQINTIYQDLTESQIKSGKLLIKFLKEKYTNITNADIYEHPDVSYKVRSEAHGSVEAFK